MVIIGRMQNCLGSGFWVLTWVAFFFPYLLWCFWRDLHLQGFVEVMCTAGHSIADPLLVSYTRLQMYLEKDFLENILRRIIADIDSVARCIFMVQYYPMYFMPTVWFEKPRCISTNLCVLSWMCLRIRLKEIIVISPPIMTVLTDVSPFFPGYMSRWVITVAQDFTIYSYFLFLHCVTVSIFWPFFWLANSMDIFQIVFPILLFLVSCEKYYILQSEYIRLFYYAYGFLKYSHYNIVKKKADAVVFTISSCICLVCWL